MIFKTGDILKIRPSEAPPMFLFQKIVAIGSGTCYLKRLNGQIQGVYLYDIKEVLAAEPTLATTFELQLFGIPHENL